MINGINAGAMSAISNARAGMQQASDNVTQASGAIANNSNKPVANITENLISLQTNTTYHQASATVPRVSDDTVGYLIDTLA